MTIDINFDGIDKAKDQFDKLADRMTKLKEEINKSLEQETDNIYKRIISGQPVVWTLDYQPVDKEFLQWVLNNARIVGEDDYNYKLPQRCMTRKLRRALR